MPDEAEVYYVVRHVEMSIVKDIWGKVVNAAKGAAIGTGTTYDLQLVGSVYSLMPNETLAKVQQRALEKVGGFTYTAEERAFAERLQKSDQFTAVPLEATAKVRATHDRPGRLRVHGRGRRELGGADGAAVGGDLGAGNVRRTRGRPSRPAARRSATRA